MNLKLIGKAAATALLLTLTGLVLNYLLHAQLRSEGMGWIFLSNFLLISVMGTYVVNSTLNGRSLALATFIISFGIGCFSILIEALIFNVTNPSETLMGLLHGFIQFALLSGVMAYWFKPIEKSETVELEVRSGSGWLWRIVASMVLYLFFYITAGLILKASLPALMEHYGDTLPPVSLIFNTQFVRGLIFAGIAIVFLRTCTLERQKKVLVLGLIFSVVGGIAPLIPPNMYMPVVIRIGHGFEVGISNFLYGWVIGMLLDQKRSLSFSV